METNYPRMEIPNIEGLSISFKKGKAKVSFEVPAPGPEMLKLVYLGAAARPLKVIFESPQAEFDLKVQTVKVETGEVQE